MLLQRTLAGSPRFALAGTIQKLLISATLLVWAGPVSGVVEQDCALPGADCTFQQRAFAAARCAAHCHLVAVAGWPLIYLISPPP